ncbi:MAG: lytic transglycosylase domain-containing protein [Fimbriimonadaceae bacterium]
MTSPDDGADHLGSNFDPYAASRPGAQGLGQLMPGTAAGLGVTDSFDINQNVWGATKYLRKQLDTFVKKRATKQKV